MKILVLGSAGQIGAPLCEYFRHKHHDVIELDVLRSSTEDLRIPNMLDSILPGVDFVFFLAFDVGGSLYLEKSQESYEFISNNIKIMNNVFDSLRKHKTRFIFTSSQMANLLTSTYGVLKNIGEKYVYALDNGKIVRFWNVYGIEKDLNRSHVITDFILMAKYDKIIKMQTDGEEYRQFLYVIDCCESLEILMNNFDIINNKELDITSFEWIKIIDIAKIISKHLNSCIEKGPKIDNPERSSALDPKKDILKYWKPHTSIETGLKKIIKYYE